MNKSKQLDKLVKISLLSAMAFLLMLIELPIPIFPAFLKIDLSDLPALVGAFALGPVAGVVIEGLKVLLNLVFHGTTTAGVGEVANFLIGASFVFTAGVIYKRNKVKRNAIKGLIAGTLIMTVIGAVINYTFLIPVYATAFHVPLNVIIGMGTKVNSNITDLSTLVLFAIVPFNLIKGAAVSFVTAAIYKKISVILTHEVVGDKKKLVG